MSSHPTVGPRARGQSTWARRFVAIGDCVGRNVAGEGEHVGLTSAFALIVTVGTVSLPFASDHRLTPPLRARSCHDPVHVPHRKADQMIQLVTDSASMLPDAVRRRFGISVVALTITIGDEDFAEGGDLTTAEFYSRMADGAAVSTAAPSPGTFVDTYRAAAENGATAVLSVHTGAAYSATVASATVAAEMVDIPVSIVDTGVGSFPVALSTWRAAELLGRGCTIEDAAMAAERTASATRSLFVVGVPVVARRGGRFVAISGELTPTTVLELTNGELHDRGAAVDLEAAIETMIDGAVAAAETGALRIGVGHAVHHEVAEQITSRLDAQLPGSEVVTYEVGPSVGAHTGPGTLGIVYVARLRR